MTIYRLVARVASAILERAPATWRLDHDRIGGWCRVLADDLRWYASHGSGRYRGGKIHYPGAT